ncbi:hypothetical protein X740_18425 [Mesorhizobium sp. LNHC221B00]|nr:hypothetical protein X740_18425 [Mesorhizobium sp. LNHC221B00]
MPQIFVPAQVLYAADDAGLNHCVAGRFMTFGAGPKCLDPLPQSVSDGAARIDESRTACLPVDRSAIRANAGSAVSRSTPRSSNSAE